MKRDKLIFAFILIPFFLFSIDFRLLRFDSNYKTIPSRFQQQTQSVNEKNPSQSQQSAAEKASSERRLPNSGRIRKETAPSGQLRNSEKFRFDSSGLSRFERKQNENSSFSGRQYVPNQVLVKFKSTLSDQMREATIAAYQSKKLKRISILDIYQLQTPENVSVEEMLYLLERNPDVEYAEPNYLRRISVTPNDPFFVSQYALFNPSQTVPPGSPQEERERPDIKAREAWDETRGEENVVIAILDTGVDFNHPDIDEKLLLNGYDFINDDSDPTDDHWHGTFVSGIAAAETNNGEGIAGVAWNCKILPIKIVDNTGWTDVSTEVNGINWAVQNGADVINLSLGGVGAAQTERDAIVYAVERDVVVVAAAGNDGAATNYPAAYDECMAVAATNSNDERVTFLNTAGDLLPWESNFGPTDEIDVAAPGDWIISLYPTNLVGPGAPPYILASGTSASTPHVAGLAALIKSIKPDLSAEDIMNIIRYTAYDANSVINPGKDIYIGYGRIDMKMALVPIIISALNKKK